MDTRNNTITVPVRGLVGKLRSEFTFANENDTTKVMQDKLAMYNLQHPANLSTISPYVFDKSRCIAHAR